MIVNNRIGASIGCDSKKFWKEVKKKKNFRVDIPNNIDEATGGNDICELWHEHYKSLFNDPSHTPPQAPSRNVLADAPVITVQEVSKAIQKINSGSSPGHDGITPTHIIASHPVLHALIAFFFNSCLKHCYLPEDLIKVILVPIVKDKNETLTSKKNYRPIALSTIYSKILEIIMLNRITCFIESSENQFAYKQGHGTEMATYALKNTVLAYTERNTPIYACFLDMSKAFDKISHHILFKRMLKRNVPKYIVPILHHWYSTQICLSNGGISYLHLLRSHVA